MRCLLFLFIVSIPAAAQFPDAEAGTQWVYRSDAGRRLVLESRGAVSLTIPGSRPPRKIGARSLEIRGGAFFWSEDGIFLIKKDDGLHCAGTRRADRIHIAHPPALLVPKQLERGQRWSGAVGLSQFRAKVLHREAIRVGSGIGAVSKKTWVVEYTGVRRGKSCDAFRVWVAPGGGIARIETTKRSRRDGSTKIPPSPLTRFTLRETRPPAPPLDKKSRALLRRHVRAFMGPEKRAARAARLEIIAFGRHAAPFLRSTQPRYSRSYQRKRKLDRLIQELESPRKMP